jgi:hypothetical protein
MSPAKTQRPQRSEKEGENHSQNSFPFELGVFAALAGGISESEREKIFPSLSWHAGAAKRSERRKKE